MVETFLIDPALFDIYIAFDPSLWWDGGALVERAARSPGTAGSRSLYLASSGQRDIAALAARFAAAIAAPAHTGITSHYAPMPAESHSTIYHPAALQAFLRLFAPLRNAE